MLLNHIAALPGSPGCLNNRQIEQCAANSSLEWSVKHEFDKVLLGLQVLKHCQESLSSADC